MSEIFNKHTSVVYESKGKNRTVPFVGQRLVVSIAKADAQKNYHPNLQQTMATSIPVLLKSEIDWWAASVQDACTEYFRSVQNSVIVDRIKATGTHTHTDAEIGVDACLSYLERESVGDTWTPERVAEWFTSTRGDALGMALLDKIADLGEERLQELMAANTKKVADCLGSKARISMVDARTLMNRLELLPQTEWDSVAVRFAKRLDSVLNPVVAEALDLGF